MRGLSLTLAAWYDSCVYHDGGARKRRPLPAFSVSASTKPRFARRPAPPETETPVNAFLTQLKSKRIIWPLLLTALIIISDQLTKAFIVEWLKPQGSVSIIGDLLRLTFVTNTGVAFGMLTGMPYVLMVPIVILICVIIFYLVKTLGQSFVLTLALTLELGGALGNLIDRVRLGYVVDFVKFPYWPAFNVADSCVVVGAIGLAFILFWQDRQETASKPETPPAP